MPFSKFQKRNSKFLAMSYYDNSPYLNSLEDGKGKSNTGFIFTLLVGIIVVSGAAIILHQKLKKNNEKLLSMQKEVNRLKAEAQDNLPAKTKPSTENKTSADQGKV